MYGTSIAIQMRQDLSTMIIMKQEWTYFPGSSETPPRRGSFGVLPLGLGKFSDEFVQKLPKVSDFLRKFSNFLAWMFFWNLNITFRRICKRNNIHNFNAIMFPFVMTRWQNINSKEKSDLLSWYRTPHAFWVPLLVLLHLLKRLPFYRIWDSAQNKVIRNL